MPRSGRICQGAQCRPRWGGRRSSNWKGSATGFQRRPSCGRRRMPAQQPLLADGAICGDWDAGVRKSCTVGAAACAGSRRWLMVTRGDCVGASGRAVD